MMRIMRITRVNQMVKVDHFPAQRARAMMIFLALTLFATPPDTLHLEACYQEAAAHYPLRQQLALHEEAAALKVDNLNARYLPSLSLGGQAIYHSEVAEIPLDLPGTDAPTISNDQYKVSLSVDQLVYDGGLVAQQKNLERLQRDLSQQEVEVELYKLREQVNAAFFGVLLRQAQAASLQTLSDDIKARLALIRSRVAQGVVLASNADVLEAELIKIRQQQAEVEAHRLAALAVIGTLIGRTLAEDSVLMLPQVSVEDAGPKARRRPEYAVFALTKSRLATQEKLATIKNRPQVIGFAEAAYGRPPGLNVFENRFKPFYSLGLRVRWPFWDWRTSQRERETLALQQQMVTAQEATFALGIDVAVQQELRDVARLEELLQSDAEIIALRERITAQTASQLENGVITATDYLIERNAEHQARLTQQLHQVQLAQAKVRYLTTVGGE